ncbi:MAG: hypothetical protein FJW61_05240 [Actinobacteria bacterium]|nr:hypothetical protein [Actinomycetota bacterium]
MTEEKTESNCFSKRNKSNGSHSGSGIMGAAYFMAFIGAAVYYILPTTTAGAGFIGFLKALVWQGFLIFDLLKYLNM